MEFLSVTTVLIAMLGAVVHFSVNRVMHRLDSFETSINRVHDRIDSHVLHWHKEVDRE